MSKIILKKNGTDYLFGLIPIHYPADRVYLDGDTTKTVQDKCARKADLTNLDLTGTTNTTGSTIPSGTYFYLNGVLVIAKTDIANGATFTLNTNYEVVTVGAFNELKNETVKHTTITATIAPGAGGAGVYSTDISPSRVVNIMCRFDSSSAANPIFVYSEKTHATRICYIGYINNNSVSQTETRTYTLDVFYI